MPNVQPPTLAELRVKYQILQPAITQDASGNMSGNPSTFIAEIWGTMVDEVRPYFLLIASGIQPKSRYTIAIRYRLGITKNMIVKETATGRQFQITDINNIGHKSEWLSLTCTEFN